MLLLKTPSVLPGFKLSLGLTVLCLSLLVVLPFAMMAAKAAEIGWSGFWNTITEPNVLAAVWLSLRMSFYAMLTNIVFGTLVAWVLVRYEFPGKGLVNALVDLPFALPTAVTGIALATLYAPNGWIGRFFRAFRYQNRLYAHRHLDCADCRQPALYRPRRAAGIGRIIGRI